MGESSVMGEPSVTGDPTFVPGRELDVGRPVVLGTVARELEIAIIVVWSEELDLKEVVGGCVTTTVDDVILAKNPEPSALGLVFIPEINYYGD